MDSDEALRVIAATERVVEDTSIVDKPTFVRRLQEIGVPVDATEEIASHGELGEIRKELRVGCARARARLQGVAAGDAVIDWFTPNERSGTELTRGIDTSRIESQLRELSPRYMSVDEMNALFEGLEGVEVSIPPDEVARLKALLPTEVIKRDRIEVRKMKGASVGEADPIILQLPQWVMYNGKRVPFTIELMDQILREEAQLNPRTTVVLEGRGGGGGTERRDLSAVINADDLRRQWDSGVRVWSSEAIAATKSNGLKKRAALAEALGEGHVPRADIVLAFALSQLKGNAPLARGESSHVSFEHENPPNAYGYTDKNPNLRMIDNRSAPDKYRFTANTMPIESYSDSQSVGMAASWPITSEAHPTENPRALLGDSGNGTRQIGETPTRRLLG